MANYVLKGVAKIVGVAREGISPPVPARGL